MWWKKAGIGLKKLDHSSMRKENLNSIFECIRRFGPMTKKEIQEKTGLSWGTTSSFTSELLGKRYISENDMHSLSSVGRTPKLYDILGTDHLIIGLDINIEGLKAVIIDLKCKVLLSRSEMLISLERDTIIEQSKKLVIDIIEASQIARERFMGLGIALMGSVDIAKGISRYIQYFKNWENVNIKKIFEDEFGFSVFIDHDPNCMAIAEMCQDEAQELTNILFIRLSLGVGMSIIQNGSIFRGATGNAGEFGHTTYDPDGPLCTCGKKGCLEVSCSILGVLSRYQSIVSDKDDAISIGRITGDFGALHMISRAARSGDKRAKSCFEEAGTVLGLGISNLISLFNPECVILGGMMMEYSDLFMDRTLETARNMTWSFIELNVKKSTLDINAAAIGAGSLLIIGKEWLKSF